MLDVFGLPETLNSNVTIFRTGGASGSGTFQTWTKPRNCSMVYILCTGPYRDWETDRKSTRLNSSHSGESRMPSSA